jgi:hypothetical protein
MSRAVTGDVREVAASNNIYTALIIVATFANILGFALLYLKYGVVFGNSAQIFQ